MSEDYRRTADDDERVQRLFNAGADFLGGSADGSATAPIGFLVARPAGAAIGAAMGGSISMALREIGWEIAARLTSLCEQGRFGLVLAAAAAPATNKARAAILSSWSS